MVLFLLPALRLPRVLGAGAIFAFIMDGPVGLQTGEFQIIIPNTYFEKLWLKAAYTSSLRPDHNF